MATWALTTASGDQNTDAIIGGTRWVGAVTFNFPISASYYPAGYEDAHPFSVNWNIPGTFQTATSGVQNAVLNILQNQFSAVCNLSFTQVAATAPADTSIAFVDFGNTFGGAAFWPQIDGDVWFTGSCGAEDPRVLSIF